MAIMTPEKLLKNLEISLKSVIIFDEEITIATDKGNAVIINKEHYDNILNNLTHQDIFVI